MTDQTNKDPLEALSCPFCGSNDISDGEVLSTNPAGGVCTQSMCRGCGALGPEAQLAPDEIDFGDEKAITAWNRRASASAALSTGDLRDRLVAVSSAIADQDDREAQAILREAMRLLDSAPAAGSVPSDASLLFTMRNIEPHLKDADAALPVLLIAARALLAQYGSPAHSAAPEVAETLRGIVNADWTQWGELACPEEFVRWAKARAAHVLSLLSAPQEGK